MVHVHVSVSVHIHVCVYILTFIGECREAPLSPDPLLPEPIKTKYMYMNILYIYIYIYIYTVYIYIYIYIYTHAKYIVNVKNVLVLIFNYTHLCTHTCTMYIKVAKYYCPTKTTIPDTDM